MTCTGGSSAVNGVEHQKMSLLIEGLLYMRHVGTGLGSYTKTSVWEMILQTRAAETRAAESVVRATTTHRAVHVHKRGSTLLLLSVTYSALHSHFFSYPQ